MKHFMIVSSLWAAFLAGFTICQYENMNDFMIFIGFVLIVVSSVILWQISEFSRVVLVILLAFVVVIVGGFERESDGE